MDSEEKKVKKRVFNSNQLALDLAQRPASRLLLRNIRKPFGELPEKAQRLYFSSHLESPERQTQNFQPQRNRN